VFPNYLQMKRRVPIAAWHVLRVVSVTAFLVLCVMLVLRPDGGLFVLWDIVVPSLPILFFVAPGLWRNICPLAAANQAPRLLGFTRARTAPKWLRERGYLVASVSSSPRYRPGKSCSTPAGRLSPCSC